MYVPVLQLISLRYIRKNPAFVKSVLENAVSTYRTGYTKEICRDKWIFISSAFSPAGCSCYNLSGYDIISSSYRMTKMWLCHKQIAYDRERNT